MTAAGYRCGFAALVGRPNTGKSTLLNALLEREVSIVTPKPQTTRHRILGISTNDAAQIVFVDTPGIHRGGRRAINRYMNRTAARSLAEADVVLLVVEATRWTEEDGDVLQRAVQAGCPILLVVNKIDLVRPKDKLLPFLEEVAAKAAFAAVIPVSAARRENLDRLRELVERHLPTSPPLYPAEQLTDRGPQFRAAEIIREKLIAGLQQELPYGLSVEVESYREDDDRLEIAAVIWVERKGQKPIIVGKQGQRLKAVGRAARLAIAAECARRVHLTLWVKVKENWSDDERMLRALGYDLP